MDTKNTHRITKDTSARKGPDMLSGAKAKLNERMNDMLLQQLQDDYTTEFERMEADHAQQIASLQAQLTQNQATNLENQKKAIDAELAKAQETFASHSAQYQQKITDLTNKNKQLQSTLDEELAKKKNELKTAQSNVARVQSQVVNLKAAHATEVTDLKRKIAIEVTFRSKGLKTRTYMLRTNTTFGEVVDKLENSVQVLMQNPVFTLNGQQITAKNQTLAAVGLCA